MLVYIRATVPSVKSLSPRQFWRYQRKVLDNAVTRWWKTAQSGWWAETISAFVTAFVQFKLDGDPTWWQPIVAFIAGATIVTLVRFLVHVPISRALMDQEQGERIRRLAGTLSDEQVERRNADRILLYKLADSVVQDYSDLEFILEKNPGASEGQVDRLRRSVEEFHRMLQKADSVLPDRYRSHFETIRRTVRADLLPRTLVEELVQPLRHLRTAVRHEREWDLARHRQTENQPALQSPEVA